MAIIETWFAESSSFNISGYNVYRRDRTSHASGVYIYVCCDLDSYEVSDVVLTDSTVEQAWCAIKICNERILIGCFYIPDPNTENKAMFTSLTRVELLMTKRTYTGLMLTGDFNHSSTSWNYLGFRTFSKNRTASKAKSTLDLIFTENRSKMSIFVHQN